LELWATERPYQTGPLTGLKVAEIALELPTPIESDTHRVECTAAARLPLQGRPHAMVLALLERGPNAQKSVRAFANYSEPHVFTAPHLQGTVGYAILDDQVVLEAETIVNPRPADNLSGTLSLELWAFSAADASADGVRLAAVTVDRLAGQARLEHAGGRVTFTEPPAGRHHLALLLCEWTLAHGPVARDRRDFGTAYLRVTDETSGPASASVAPPVSESPPTSTLASTSDEPSLPSIQTASVDELAAVKGITAKIAKEIVKARPFASVDDLVRVRGLGPKSVARLKGLVTL